MLSHSYRLRRLTRLMERTGAGLRATLRIVLLLAWTVLLFIQQLLGFLLRTGDGRHIRCRFYRGALRILGVRMLLRGQFSPRRPLLIAANHVSYLDIFVLGSRIPGVFVSKDEVQQWPLIGWIARLQNTIFISRRPGNSRLELNPIVGHLSQGHNVFLFPEGTSTDGRRLLPFKSSLFEAAIQGGAYVQPVALVYRHRHGGPLSAKERALYTWGTDAPFLSHFAKMLLRPGVACEIWVRPEISPTLSRKMLAQLTHLRIAAPLRHREHLDLLGLQHADRSR